MEDIRAIQKGQNEVETALAGGYMIMADCTMRGMPPMFLAISTLDRIGQGLLAVLLCLPVLIVWVFLLILSGFVWNRLTLPKRRRAMGGMLIVLWIATCGLQFVIPTTGYETEVPPGSIRFPDENYAYTEHKRIGITFWYVKSTRFESWLSPLSSGTTSTEFSIVGILAILPLFVALGMLAR